MPDLTDADKIIRARIPYEPITERPKLRLPSGARVAVWTIVNVENWLADGPMPRTILAPPMRQPLPPHVPNWAWHEYGMRVRQERLAHPRAGGRSEKENPETPTQSLFT